MGDTYTRQSSYTDGDVITAAHTNNEFNQLLAAFAASTGHSHDGTAGEGGAVTKLLSNVLTFGAGTAGTDITITFDGETNDGVMKWMEDEDYFEFSDDILIASTEKLQFRDTAIYINSSADGQLDLVADTEIQIAATTIDINGNVDISGTLTIGSAGISEAELEVLDGLTVSTAEVNILDGDTSATSTTVADADRVVLNDNGTMVQVAVTDLAAYFDDEITAMPNLVTTAATTVGALNSGSITSGFGTIDTGSSTITTTGLITGGSLDIDDVVINGTTIGHTDDTDLITVADGVVTVAGEVSMTTLDIGGTNVTSTAAELNYSDTGASVGTVVASKVVTADANKDVASFRNITLTGELDAGSLDVSGDADIDGTLEADAITVGGTALNTVIAGVTVTNATTAAVATTVTISDNESTNEENAVIFTSGGDVDGGNIGLESDGDLTYNPSTGTVSATIFKGNIDAVDGDFDGTLEADAITVGGVSLAETISDTVGAMFSSNTETGITATYQDADNTIDLVIGAGDIVNSMLADDAVGADELAANAVVTASIVDDNVTQAKIADDAVGADQLASSAVVTASIVDANVTLAKIANQAANTVLVRDANSSGVVSAKAVTNTQILIGDGTGFTAAALSGDVTMTNAGVVTIGAGAVENSMLADDAVGADELAANAVVEASIVDNAVTLAKMAGIARGKLIIGDASGDPSVIGPGSANQVLTSDGTDIAFADPAGASSLAADNLTAGDAAVVLSTTSGTITIDNAANDADIIFKGTDGGADITALTLDMSAAGAATFNNDVTAFSDRRLKTDITNIDNALSKVMHMQGVYYKRNDTADARTQVGVIAQEIESVLPEVVLTADDEMQTKSVDYGKICAVLIESIKELKNEIEELKAR